MDEHHFSHYLHKMTIRPILFIVVVICLTGCGPGDVRSTDQPLLAGVQEKTLDGFERFKNHAVVLPGVLKVFDNSTKAIGQITFDAITPVEIVEKTKGVYSLDTLGQCSAANFLKIKHNDHEHTVFGADVYEVLRDQVYPINVQGRPVYEVFPVRHFEVYSKVKEGGFACDGYSLLVVKRLEDQHYSLVEERRDFRLDPASGGKPENYKYLRLLDDYGAQERLAAGDFENDSTYSHSIDRIQNYII
jgi:hypothetical protein